VSLRGEQLWVRRFSQRRLGAHGRDGIMRHGSIWLWITYTRPRAGYGMSLMVTRGYDRDV
jgi:hypothetical protein